MTPTIDLLTDTLETLRKQQADYQAILEKINEKISSHEKALEILQR